MDQPELERQRAQIARIDKALAILHEHFDTVIIFAHEVGRTGDEVIKYSKAFGNLLAVQAQVREWVTAVDAIGVSGQVALIMENRKRIEGQSGDANPFQQ